MKTNKEFLIACSTAIGATALTPRERLVFLVVAWLGEEATRKDICAFTGISRSHIYELLSCLSKKGLISQNRTQVCPNTEQISQNGTQECPNTEQMSQNGCNSEGQQQEDDSPPQCPPSSSPPNPLNNNPPIIPPHTLRARARMLLMNGGQTTHQRVEEKKPFVNRFISKLLTVA